MSCLPVQVWEGVQEGGETPPLLLLPSGTPLPGHSLPFAVTQKCFLVSIKEQWDPGTHVAKPELLGALSSCRGLQQAYFPSLLLPHALMGALWGTSNDLRVVWQWVRAQKAVRGQRSCKAALRRNGISMEKRGRERSDPCGGLQDFDTHWQETNKKEWHLQNVSGSLL